MSAKRFEHPPVDEMRGRKSGFVGIADEIVEIEGVEADVLHQFCRMQEQEGARAGSASHSGV